MPRRRFAMNSIVVAAATIGISTLMGAAVGFLLNNVSQLWNDIVTAFAAGVMLAAAMFGLFQPAMEMGSMIQLLSGALAGMVFLRICAKMMPGGMLNAHPELMFVAALALHKFPEGMAGGVALSGSGIMVALGVALQNLPEGVVMIPPLLAAGVTRCRAALIALLTGLLNVLGVAAGAAWGAVCSNVLPMALAFAGGAMLDVIMKDMVPRVSASGLKRGEWIIASGFLMMAAANMLL